MTPSSEVLETLGKFIKLPDAPITRIVLVLEANKEPLLKITVEVEPVTIVDDAILVNTTEYTLVEKEGE